MGGGGGGAEVGVRVYLRFSICAPCVCFSVPIMRARCFVFACARIMSVY